MANPTDIKARRYSAPTAADRNAWAVGVLNLTSDEADEVMRFTRALTGRRRIAAAKEDKGYGSRTLTQAMTNMESRDADYARDSIRDAARLNPFQAAARTMLGLDGEPSPDDARVQMVADALEAKEDSIRDAARRPEPEEERNRFSGLDLD